MTAMNAAIRGMRWRAAWMVVAAALVVLWMTASDSWRPVIRIDYQMVGPMLDGAEVHIDGAPAGTLESVGRQYATGFRVAKGTHVVEVRTDDCVSRPDTVDVGGTAGRLRVLVADLDDGFDCRVLLRE